MTESSLVDLANPASISFRNLEKNVGELIEVRKIASGGKDPNLGLVFERSLLGDRLSGYTVDETNLGPYERKIRDKKDLDINIIVDFDGVVVSPAHLQRGAGFKNMLWLARMAKSSNKMTIWTNRYQPKNERFSNVGVFPFLGENVSKRITDMLNKQGNAEIKKKSLRNNGSDLVEMTKGYDLTIFVGSGKVDRKIIRDYLKEGGDPKKLIYFDTGHLVL